MSFVSQSADRAHLSIQVSGHQVFTGPQRLNDSLNLKKQYEILGNVLSCSCIRILMNIKVN